MSLTFGELSKLFYASFDIHFVRFNTLNVMFKKVGILSLFE